MFNKKRQKSNEPNFNKKTIKALKEAERMEKHPNRYKSFNSVDKLVADLRK